MDHVFLTGEFGESRVFAYTASCVLIRSIIFSAYFCFVVWKSNVKFKDIEFIHTIPKLRTISKDEFQKSFDKQKFAEINILYSKGRIKKNYKVSIVPPWMVNTASVAILLENI